MMVLIFIDLKHILKFHIPPDFHPNLKRDDGKCVRESNISHEVSDVISRKKIGISVFLEIDQNIF